MKSAGPLCLPASPPREVIDAHLPIVSIEKKKPHQEFRGFSKKSLNFQKSHWCLLSAVNFTSFYLYHYFFITWIAQRILCSNYLHRAWTEERFICSRLYLGLLYVLSWPKAAPPWPNQWRSRFRERPPEKKVFPAIHQHTRSTKQKLHTSPSPRPSPTPSNSFRLPLACYLQQLSMNNLLYWSCNLCNRITSQCVVSVTHSTDIIQPPRKTFLSLWALKTYFDSSPSQQSLDSTSHAPSNV